MKHLLDKIQPEEPKGDSQYSVTLNSMRKETYNKLANAAREKKMKISTYVKKLLDLIVKDVRI